MSWTDKAQGLGILALLAGGLYLAYRYTRGSTSGPGACDGLAGLPKMLCDIGIFATGADPSGTINPAPVPDVLPTKWCGTLGRYILAELTCPNAPDPVIVHPTDPQPGYSWCEKQGHYVMDYLATPEYCDPKYSPVVPSSPIPAQPYGMYGKCYGKNGTLMFSLMSYQNESQCPELVESFCKRFNYNHAGC